jgi:hypothetical protein
MSAKSKRPNARVVSISAARPAGPRVETCLGTITSWSSKDGVVVDYAGNLRGPRPALSTVPMSKEELDDLVASRRQVVLTLTCDGSELPIVIGVVQTVPAGRVGGRVRKETAAAQVRAVVDGDEVLLEGNERVELRCGKASIVLTKAGKVLIQGTYISSRSSGAHRVRGGSVEVN